MIISPPVQASRLGHITIVSPYPHGFLVGKLPNTQVGGSRPFILSKTTDKFAFRKRI
jgi:hypothetical protein